MRTRSLLLAGAGVVVVLAAMTFLGPAAGASAATSGEARGPPPRPAAPPDAPSPREAPPALPPTVVGESARAPAPRERLDVRAARQALSARGGPVGDEVFAGPTPVMPAAPPVDAWSQVPVVNPFGAGSPAPEVTRALRAAVPGLGRCFERSTAASWARLGSVYSREPALPPPALGPAVLLLEAERDGDGVRIVDAPAELRGSASDGTLNCAQAALRGVHLPVKTQGAERFRVRLPLRP